MRKIFIFYLLCLCSISLKAQNTYIPLGYDEYRLVDRIETSQKFLSPRLSTSLKPYARMDVVDLCLDFQEYYQLTVNAYANPVDFYNVGRAINISGEWGKVNSMYPDATERRSKPILKYFFPTEPNFIQYSDEDNFFVLNPVLYLQSGLENNHSDMRYIWMRGAETRARLFNKIGVYGFIAETQEKFSKYLTEKALGEKNFPGFDFYTGGASKKPFDGFMARGYVDFPIYKDYVNATFGYDKNFIGDGMRSLFLDQTGAPYTFLRLRSHFGRFHYQNLFMELKNDYYGALDRSIPKKYASMHYLGFNIGNRFNLGLFESTIFSPINKVGVMNFVPVILANSVYKTIDKNVQNQTSLGLNFKAILAKDFLLYGQGLVQSMDLSKISENNWKNRFGTQLGFKYTNIFQFTSFDMQMEWNMARPWLYSAIDSVTNYTHYNQTLAHPMGNGFHEFILALYFQPSTKLDLEAKAIFTLKGSDSLGNYTSGIFQSINASNLNLPYPILDNNRKKSLFFNFNASYEFFQNLYLDAGVSQMTIKQHETDKTSTMVYAGIRWNIAKRNYDFW